MLLPLPATSSPVRPLQPEDLGQDTRGKQVREGGSAARKGLTSPPWGRVMEGHRSWGQQAWLFPIVSQTDTQAGSIARNLCITLCIIKREKRSQLSCCGVSVFYFKLPENLFVNLFHHVSFLCKHQKKNLSDMRGIRYFPEGHCVWTQPFRTNFPLSCQHPSFLPTWPSERLAVPVAEFPRRQFFCCSWKFPLIRLHTTFSWAKMPAA